MPNGGSRLPTTATTVIGLGRAGCRMLAAVNEVVEQSSPDAFYNYVAIDSNPADLEKYAPSDSMTVCLDPAEQFWVDDRESYSYLTDVLELAGPMGTNRTRRLGRYLVDSRQNFDDAVGAIDDALSTAAGAAGGEQAGVHQIWLLFALGGGTGSGAAPLVAALAHDIAAQANHETLVAGVGSLPRLDSGELSVRAPSGPSEVYVNAYTTLRELAVLMDYDGDDPYPIELDVETTTDRFSDGRLQLDGSPLDILGLLGMRQSASSNATVDHKNRIAAYTVYALSRKHVFTSQTGLATFGPGTGFGPNPPWMTGGDNRLFSVDGTDVGVQLEEIEAHLDTRTTLTTIEDRIGTLERDREQLEEALAYLDEMLDWRPASDDAPVAAGVVRDARDRVREPYQYVTEPSTTDSTVAHLREDLDAPAHLDEESVTTYVFLHELTDQLRDELAAHQLRYKLEEALDKYDHALEDAPEEVADPFEQPLTAWETVLRPALVQQRNQLEEKREQLLFRILTKLDLGETLEELREDFRALEYLADEFQTYREVYDRTTNRLQAVQEQLRDRRATLAARRYEKRDALDELVDKRRDLRIEADRLADSLESLQQERGVSLPINQVDRMDGSVIENARALTALVENGYVDDADLVRGLTSALRTLEEPTQDRTVPGRTPSVSDAAILITNDEGQELVEEFGDVCPDDGESLSTVLGQFDSVSEISSGVPMSVYALGVYAPISLEETSEYGALHEYYRSDDHELSEQFVGEITDADVTRQFAYPELVE